MTYCATRLLQYFYSFSLKSFFWVTLIYSIPGQGGLDPVTVRIWEDGLHGGVHVGHVSIDTGRHYISLWPTMDKDSRLEGTVGIDTEAAPLAAKVINRFYGNTGGCIISKAIGNNLTGDLNDEGRPPEQVIQLSLDGENIDTFWKNLCEGERCPPENNYYDTRVYFSNLDWYVGGNPERHTLKGDIPETLHNRMASRRNYSCASLVFRALSHGGIAQHGYIPEEDILTLVPAAREDWYQQRAIVDSTQRYFARFSDPLVREYITPHKVGELTLLAACNQHIKTLVHPLNNLEFMTDKLLKEMKRVIRHIVEVHRPDPKIKDGFQIVKEAHRPDRKKKDGFQKIKSEEKQEKVVWRPSEDIRVRYIEEAAGCSIEKVESTLRLQVDSRVEELKALYHFDRDTWVAYIAPSSYWRGITKYWGE